MVGPPWGLPTNSEVRNHAVEGGAWALWVVVTAAAPRVTQALDLGMATTDGAIVTDCIWTNSAPHREASRWLGPNVLISDGVPDAAHLDL